MTRPAVTSAPNPPATKEPIPTVSSPKLKTPRKPTGRRTQYTEAQKELVRSKYPHCRSLADKEALAAEANVGSVHKLYNLASRLNVTRTHDEWARRPDEKVAERPDPALDRARLRMRESFSATVFTPEDDEFLVRNFGRQTIEQIAFHRSHTVTAMIYRARHLDLRRPAKYWDAEQVAAWLCIAEDRWEELAGEGLVRHRLTDRRGRVKLSVVASIALARWLVRGNRWQRLVADDGADEFFCREILESVADLQQRTTDWEACAHLSAGHVCNNTYSATGFGLFCTNNERFTAGADPKCSVRQLRPEDLRPER